MSLLNFLLSSPVTPWAMLLLSASSLTITLTLLVKALTSLKSSTLTKSQKESLTNFLPMLNSFLTATLPNLSDALRTVLLNKGLLNMQNQNQQLDQDQEQQVLITPTLEQIEKITNFIKETFGDEKH